MAADLNSVDLDKLIAAIECSRQLIGKEDNGLRGELRRFIGLHNDVIAGCRVPLAAQVSIAKTDALLAQWAMTDTDGWGVYDTLVPMGSGTVQFGGGPILKHLKANARGRPEITAEAGVLLGMPPTSGYSDDPVCMANGNFVHQETEIDVIGFGAVIAPVRTYNALAYEVEGLFGGGWSSLLDMSVTDSGDSVGVRFVDGAWLTFARDADSGGFVRQRQRNLDLRPAGDGWELVGEDDTWHFDGEGRISGGSSGYARFTVERAAAHVTVSEERSGRSVCYVIDDGRVRSCRSSDGRSAIYSYVNGFCVGVERPSGDITYELDGDGRIAAMIDADSVVLARNTYDEFGRVASQTNEHGRTSTYEYRENGTARVRYGDDGPTNLYAHDDAGNLTAVYGGDGGAMRMVWDDRNRLVKLTERGGAQTRYTYDPDATHDLPVTITHPDGLTEHHTYDQTGRPTIWTDRAGSTHTYRYHGSSSLPSEVIGPDGSTSVFEFDDLGQLVSLVDADGETTQYQWGSDGLLDTIESPGGGTTLVERDSAGRVLALRFTDGRWAGFRYDEVGRLIWQREEDGHETEYAHTPAGRVRAATSTRSGPWSGKLGSSGLVEETLDGGGGVTSISYNDDGRPEIIVGPLGAVTTRVYDTLGRLNVNGAPLSRDTQHRYDSAGNLETFVDPEGGQWSRSSDVFGRIVSTNLPSGRVHSWSYHPTGQLATHTTPDGAETRYQIDTAGRIIELIDPVGRATTFTYTPAGRLQQAVSPAGRALTPGANADQPFIVGSSAVAVELTFDDQGRLRSWQTHGAPAVPSSALLPLPSMVGVHGLSANLDDIVPALAGFAGHNGDFVPASVLTSRVDTATQSPPDPLRAARRPVSDPALPAATTSPSDRLWFDHQRRLRVAATAAGNLESYLTDLSSALVCVGAGAHRTTLSYDAAGRVVAITRPRGTTTLDYDRCDRITAISTPAGVNRRYGYDDDGRLAARGSGLIDRDRFEYDRTGRLVEASSDSHTIRFEWTSAASLAKVSVPGGEATYVQRDGDELVAATRDDHGKTTWYRRNEDGVLTSYETEASGVVAVPATDRASTRDQEGRIIADADGRLHSYDQAGRIVESVGLDGQARSFGYDDRGLLAWDVTPHFGRRTFHYRLDGALIIIDDESGPLVRMSYDDDGRRTEEQHRDGRVVAYTWSDFDELVAITATLANGSAITIELEWDPLSIVRAISGEEIGWDHAGDGKPVRIGVSGLLRHHWRVRPDERDAEWTDGLVDDPFGYEPSTETRPTVGFRGELSVFGVVVMGARIYHPESRCFLTPDPLPSVPGLDTIDQGYVYARHDPVNLLDPSGLRPLSEADLCSQKGELEKTIWNKHGGKIALGSAVLGIPGPGMIWLAERWKSSRSGARIGAGTNATLPVAEAIRERAGSTTAPFCPPPNDAASPSSPPDPPSVMSTGGPLPFDISPLKGEVPDDVYAQLPSVIESCDFQTSEQLAHFLAQCSAESGGFAHTEENLNYSAERIPEVFSQGRMQGAPPSVLARNPEALGNHVYAGVNGNGDVASGDGFRYRGRGYIQVTGKENFRQAGEVLNQDLVGNPESADPLEVSAAWWSMNDMNEKIDDGWEVKQVSGAVNRGDPSKTALHLEDRSAAYNRYSGLLS